jgi:hypothetical protein
VGGGKNPKQKFGAQYGITEHSHPIGVLAKAQKKVVGMAL